MGCSSCGQSLSGGGGSDIWLILGAIGAGLLGYFLLGRKQ